ncbi:MAG: MptD family putative ECF transporter S component, partial [Eggerthella lenta]
KDAYRSPVRNTVGWTIWAVGMVIGNAVPVWAAWDAYVAKATTDGFTAPVLTMQLDLLSNPLHLLGACAITAVLAVLGCLFGNRLLRKHFKKAGIVK